jgi:hypothetical protein
MSIEQGCSLLASLPLLLPFIVTVTLSATQDSCCIWRANYELKNVLLYDPGTYIIIALKVIA